MQVAETKTVQSPKLGTMIYDEQVLNRPTSCASGTATRSRSSSFRANFDQKTHLDARVQEEAPRMRQFAIDAEIEAINLHGCFRTPIATGSELKRAPRRPNRRKPLEIQEFNTESRERSLSAFCVNRLTGSFRAKNLSSPD